MLSIKIIDAVPLENTELLVFFEDGIAKKFDVKALFREYPEYRMLEDPALFQQAKVEPGGYGVSWNEVLDCSEGELYENGVAVPLSIADFRSFAEHNLIGIGEAAAILHCSKQNIEDLVRRGKLHPIRYDARHKLFLRAEVEARTWQDK